MSDKHDEAISKVLGFLEEQTNLIKQAEYLRQCQEAEQGKEDARRAEQRKAEQRTWWRNTFAACALQGLCAARPGLDTVVQTQLVVTAVRLADRLVAELDGKP